MPYVSKAQLSRHFNLLYFSFDVSLCTLDTLFAWRATLRRFDISTVLIVPVAASSCSNTISPSFRISAPSLESKHPNLSLLSTNIQVLAISSHVSCLSSISHPLSSWTPNPHLPLQNIGSNQDQGVLNNIPYFFEWVGCFYTRREGTERQDWMCKSCVVCCQFSLGGFFDEGLVNGHWRFVLLETHQNGSKRIKDEQPTLACSFSDCALQACVTVSAFLHISIVILLRPPWCQMCLPQLSLLHHLCSPHWSDLQHEHLHHRLRSFWGWRWGWQWACHGCLWVKGCCC